MTTLPTWRSSGRFAKARPVPFERVRWEGGFWGERMAQLRSVMLPSMQRLMEGDQRTHFLQNLKIAAGVAEGRHRGPKWNDGDFYKWFEAVAAVYAQAPEPAVDRLMDSLIDVIGRAQAADGYLHTPVLIARRNGQPAERFADPMHFEMYNMGHLMLAGCMHFRATGKRTLLEIAQKAADYLDRAFAAPTPAMARHGICPVHLTGLIEMARATGEERYIRLADRLLTMRDLVEQGDDDNQDRVPFRQQREAVGHAVRATYLYAGATDLYTETGEAALLEALNPIWRDLVGTKLSITGGCGALHDGASPDGAIDQTIITRVHQAFGRPYQLPHSTAHNETCAAIGNLLWNARMHQVQPRAAFGDLIEQTLYNSVLAGMSLDGTRFFYTNTLRQLDCMPVPQRWPPQRQEYISCYCCPPNILRVLAQVGGLAYSQDDGGLYVTLYGNNQLQTTLSQGLNVRVEQRTDYPWDGRVALRVSVDRAAEFALRLRIPAWARGAMVQVNDQAVTPAQAGEYFAIQRRWEDGDAVRLDLPMAAELIGAHPLVEEMRNHAAVQRGPIIYCAESTDLPGGIRLMEVYLPRGARPTPGAEPGPGGTMALECRALALHAGAEQPGLYHPLAEARAEAFMLKLIPYFAWGNRGKSEMTVWLPLATGGE